MKKKKEKSELSNGTPMDQSRLQPKTSQKSIDDVAKERFLNVQEVAELLGLSPGTVYHLISEHRIPTVHVSSRCVRFQLSALLEWVESVSQPVDHQTRKRGGVS